MYATDMLYFLEQYDFKKLSIVQVERALKINRFHKNYSRFMQDYKLIFRVLFEHPENVDTFEVSTQEVDSKIVGDKEVVTYAVLLFNEVRFYIEKQLPTKAAQSLPNNTTRFFYN